MKKRRIAPLHVAVVVIVAVVGVAAAIAVLANQPQGAPNPSRDVYEIEAELRNASGVKPDIGQPVNVAGVEVGTIVGTDHSAGGNALVTLELERDELPHVYADARATLRPVTPLKDMSIELEPGRPPAPELPEHGVIGVGRTRTATDLSRLLRALDSDTRSFLRSTIRSFDVGTAGRATDMRRMLRTLGPTTAQARRISSALAGRRRELARLVHNLGGVMDAASRDGDLATVVAAGNRTLAAVARQDRPLRQSIAQLPGTLRTTRAALDEAATFSDKLTPTLRSLRPAVWRLPRALTALRPFGRQTSSMLSERVRPLVRGVRPIVRDLAPTTRDLDAVAPPMADTLQSFEYTLNTLAYNPPGKDEGGLFWAPWMMHNWLSTWSISDAHGVLGRATLLDSCQNLTSFVDSAISAIVTAPLKISDYCPNG